MGDLGDMGRTIEADEDEGDIFNAVYMHQGYAFSVKDLTKKIQLNVNTSVELEDFIETMEEDYPTLTKAFRRIQIEQYLVFLTKHHDYGLHNIDMNEDVSGPEGKILPTTGLIIRMNDKIARLKNIVKKGVAMVGAESLLDTFRDLSVYGIIAQLIDSGEWKRG